MKFLFDQNISYRILKKVETDYPDAQQVRRLGLDNTSDIEIWEYAKKYDFSIVTFDGDFADIATFKGHPPKVLGYEQEIPPLIILHRSLLKKKS